MRRILLFLLSVVLLSPAVPAQNKTELPAVPPPEAFRRPADAKPYQYKYSTDELRQLYTEAFRVRAAHTMGRVDYINTQGEWKADSASLSRHTCPEWFEDLKFGMFIDWGPWAIPAWAGRNEKGAAYPDWYDNRMYGPLKEYHSRWWGSDFERDDFIPLFKAEKYDADELVRIARESGMRYVVPFTKHHAGYCLWPSSYTFRHSVEMGPGRDLIGPLAEACRRQGLKFGCYFSVDEWEYPMLDSADRYYLHVWDSAPLTHDALYDPAYERRMCGKVPVRDFKRDYIIPQAVELIDLYEPDLLWLDGEWHSLVETVGSYDIAAYYYNTVGKRKEVAVNDRYGVLTDKGNPREHRTRGRIGDFYTSEYHSLADGQKDHPWEENRGISQSFGFNWEDTESNIITDEQFIRMFVRTVADGGNFLLIVGPDGQGTIPEIQRNRLRSIGAWLRVNGEAIYGTRSARIAPQALPQRKGDPGAVHFTRSKDGSTLYAIFTAWPGRKLTIRGVTPAEGSDVVLLGDGRPLRWKCTADGATVVELPADLQNIKGRPCANAWSLRICR